MPWTWQKGLYLPKKMALLGLGSCPSSALLKVCKGLRWALGLQTEIEPNILGKMCMIDYEI